MLHNRDGRLLNSSKVKKAELLETLNKNLVKHITDVKEALVMRREAIKQKLDSEVVSIFDSDSYQPEAHLHFPLPVSNVKDYQKAIRMVEMTQDEVIELNEQQFDRLVMDEWDWKNELITTSAVYGKTM